jgi:hypothetical protein
MLHDFITSNRQELISRCRAKVASRFEPTGTPAAIDHGVPLFLQQLVETLRLEQTTATQHGTDSDPTPAPTEIGRAAALHGTELLRLGYSVDQVVHDYGDVCQSVTALAVEQDIPISTDEFRTLNRCLDNAIADAVASFGCARQISIDRQAETLQQRLVIFAAEQQRLIGIAIQSYTAIKTGNVGLTGATGTLLILALEDLRSLADRTLPEIRLASPAITVVSALSFRSGKRLS